MAFSSDNFISICFKYCSMKTSLIIPAYDEEKTIEEIICSAKKYVDEILVVVAKKSKDHTFEIATKYANNCIIDDGVGKGAALKLGVKHSKGDIIIFMDSDGSHDASDIPKLVAPIKESDFDLVVGSRALGGSDELHGTLGEFIRNAGGAVVMLCINYFYGVRFTDCENGFRAIKKTVFTDLKLKANDFDIEQEMFIKAMRKKCKILEVPAHEYRRKFGESKLSPLKIGWKFVYRLIVSFFD